MLLSISLYFTLLHFISLYTLKVFLATNATRYGQPRADTPNNTPELNDKDRLMVAQELAQSGTWGISLIGGEPTLVEGLADYVGILSRGGCYTSVGTSGHRIERHLSGLLAAGLDNIVFSMDHFVAAEHDAFRGRQGLFEEASEAIERIRSQGGKRPRVQVRATMHRGNLEDIPEIIRYWESRVDNVVVQVVQSNGIHEVRDASVLFQPEDRPRLEEVVQVLQTAWPALRTPYFDHLVDYVFDAEALRKRLDFRCRVVPGASMLIMPNGDMRLCYGHEESTVGNIMHTEVSNAWTSQSTCGIRRHMQSRELKCMCWEQTNSLNLNLGKLLPHNSSNIAAH